MDEIHQALLSRIFNLDESTNYSNNTSFIRHCAAVRCTLSCLIEGTLKADKNIDSFFDCSKQSLKPGFTSTHAVIKFSLALDRQLNFQQNWQFQPNQKEGGGRCCKFPEIIKICCDEIEEQIFKNKLTKDLVSFCPAINEFQTIFN
jgi:hypothetical protein